MFGIAENQEFLKAIGIADAPEETKQTLIAGIEDIAQKKLVIKLSERLTEEQAEEFSKITDEKQASDWLLTNVPDFEAMVTEIFNDIKYDIMQHKMEVVGK